MSYYVRSLVLYVVIAFMDRIISSDMFSDSVIQIETVIIIP